MPISLVQIAANTADASFEYMGETVGVKYRPALITEETFARLMMFQKSKTELEVIERFGDVNNILSELIASWEFYEDEELTMMVPLTVDRLKTVPLEIRLAALGAITQSFHPEAETPQKTLNSSL